MLSEDNKGDMEQDIEKISCSIIIIMELNKIWNESNEVTMKEHIDMNSVDLILTSPPYNNCRDNAEKTNDKPFINAVGELAPSTSVTLARIVN